MLQTRVFAFPIITLSSLLVFGMFGGLIAIYTKQNSGGSWIDITPTPSQIIKLCLIVDLVHGLVIAVIAIIKGTETVSSLFLSTMIGIAITAAFSAVLVTVLSIGDPTRDCWGLCNVSQVIHSVYIYFLIFALILLIPSVIALFICTISLKFIGNMKLDAW